MSLELFVHPFSSYSWKALIAIWADGTAFEYRKVSEEAGQLRQSCNELWPFAKFPVLVDNGEVIPEATCIIEHLQAHHPGPNVWIPDGDLGRRVRFLDRFFDLHVQGNMQPSVNHALRPEGQGDAYGAEQGLKNLQHCLRLARGQSAGDGWAAGDSVHPRRLRRGARTLLRRLGRGDR